MRVRSLGREELLEAGTATHGISGKNAGVDCHFLLQGIFPIQGLNPGLPHCRQMLYPQPSSTAPRSYRPSQGFPGPRAHGRAPRTIAAASIVVPSPGASYGEAGEEGMRLEALPEE